MAGETFIIRDANLSDTAAMLEIYAPYVLNTGISFEEQVPSLDEFSARVEKYIAGWRCLVAERDGRVLGYAYGSAHRERPAYRWSVETSVYVASDAHRNGVGRSLYQLLTPQLAERGFCNAFAGVALPNAASIALHEAVGFRHIGTFPRVGFKLGAWRDVAWFYLPLRNEPALGSVA